LRREFGQRSDLPLTDDDPEHYADYPFIELDSRDDRPYVDWIKRIALWDGILPMAVGATMPLARWFFPRQEGVALTAAVAVPIVAFFVRLAIGSRYFETHFHWAWQGYLFFLAILYLIFIDALILLAGMEDMDPEVVEVLAVVLVLYLPYLAMMALAFFPRHPYVKEEVA
jgi:hypothetical protein